jgi:autotransporter translocation and assembly factor TamB
MDKKIVGLLGAAAALTTMSAAQSAVAEPTPNTPPTSYRDLLEPIPDAVNALKIDDARIAAAKTQAGEQVAQHYYHHHHHLTM